LALASLCVPAPVYAAPAQPVQAAALTPVVWRPTIDVSAAVDADQNAVLAAQQAGRVVAVLFRSGQQVPAGALLVQLDNGTQVAQLALDTAKQQQARRALAREEKLLSIAGASQAALEQAQADAAEAAAQINYDQAALAQLQIIAPFAGTLGIRKISAGDYLAQGQEVARITQTAPLRVIFSVPQTQGAMLAVGDAFTLAIPASASAAESVPGRITALSPMIDQASNARDAEGEVANRAGLLPGMYGVVTLQTGAPVPAFSLPATALNDSILGRYVYVLDPVKTGGDTLRAVYVREYSQSGASAVIAASGLAAGEPVVAEGGFNLSDGAAVTIAK
jgi:RND family efflux transporter MFP subunit